MSHDREKKPFTLADALTPRQGSSSGFGLPTFGLLGSQPPSAGGYGLLQALGAGLPSQTFPLGQLASLSAAPTSVGDRQWIYVTNRFRTFVDNLALTSIQVADGETKFGGVVSCLNSAYYGHNSASQNAFYIGSWAKQTRIRPPRDVDLYFVLPVAVYQRFEPYQGNRQSALLQEVKTRLLARYPKSDIKGDGPVVLVGFESYSVEVVPAFLYSADERSYYVCDTKGGGRYMTTKPLHEVDAISAADSRNAGNVRGLVQMLKAWQTWCSVPIKSFYLELLAIEFMDQCDWRLHGYFFYDWISRDFFKWMVTKANTFVWAPGTNEPLWLGGAWKSRAETAYGRAVKACEYERENLEGLAGDEWQKIYGPQIPKWV